MPTYYFTVSNQTTASTTWWPTMASTYTATTGTTVPTGWYYTGQTVWYQPQAQTYEEQAEVQRMMMTREVVRQRRALSRHSDEAKSRARDLLLGHLTLAQRETFEKNSWFVVEGGNSQTKYRINDSHHMVANIDVMGDVPDKVKHRLCGHCGLDDVPIGDQLLAQKLMLEYDEDRFLRLANRHPALAA